MEPSVAQVSRAILGYLLRRPQAQDTIEGIAEWWLLQWRVDVVVATVRRAVSGLCEQGLIREVEDRHSGTRRYTVNRAQIDRIRRFLDETDVQP